MMSMYPTARNYRSKPGTIRVPLGDPGRPRRTPGRPAPRVRPTYRPAPPRPVMPSRPPGLPVPRPLPGQVRPPRIPPRIGGWAGAMRGIGPYGAAFEIGFLLGWIILQPRPGELVVNNPAGWREYICPTTPGFPVVGPVTTGFANVQGVDPANCISGQYISGGGSNLRRSFWEQYGPNPGNHAHVATFIRNSGWPIEPRPEIAVIPAGRPLPIQNPDFQYGIGRGIWADPLASPIISPVPWVGPVAPPIRGPGNVGRPSPGVGNEGYGSGEPSKPQQPKPQPNPVPEPAPYPQPQPHPFPRPPEKGVKERKMRANPVVSALGRIYGGITELDDFIDSFHDAIDKDCGKKAGPVWDSNLRGGDDGKSWYRTPRGKWVRRVGRYRAPSMMEKGAAVYRNAHCIDIGEALWNVLMNAIEDRIMSLGSKKAREAAIKDFEGIRRGYEFGPAL